VAKGDLKGMAEGQGLDQIFKMFQFPAVEPVIIDLDQTFQMAGPDDKFILT